MVVKHTWMHLYYSLHYVFTWWWWNFPPCFCKKKMYFTAFQFVCSYAGWQKSILIHLLGILNNFCGLCWLVHYLYLICYVLKECSVQGKQIACSDNNSDERFRLSHCGRVRYSPRIHFFESANITTCAG